jgi:hypothetical protein
MAFVAVVADVAYVALVTIVYHLWILAREH